MESKLTVSSMTGEGNSLQEVIVKQETYLKGRTKTCAQVKYEREYLTLQTTTVINQLKVVETYITRIMTQLNSTLVENICLEFSGSLRTTPYNTF